MPHRRNSPSPGTNVKGPNDTGPRSAGESRSMPLVAFDGSLGPLVPPVEIGPLGLSQRPTERSERPFAGEA
jgi:hypothetical protein